MATMSPGEIIVALVGKDDSLVIFYCVKMCTSYGKSEAIIGLLKRVLDARTDGKITTDVCRAIRAACPVEEDGTTARIQDDAPVRVRKCLENLLQVA